MFYAFNARYWSVAGVGELSSSSCSFLRVHQYVSNTNVINAVCGEAAFGGPSTLEKQV